MRWALLLALLATSALASRADRLSVSPRLDRRDRLGASSAASPILLSLSLLPPDSECSGTPPGGVTFTRASNATCIDSSGLAYNFTTNQARATSKGLLVERQTTNNLLRSRSLTTAPWNPGPCASSSEFGMDGTTNVATCGSGSVNQTVTNLTGARTFSVYARALGTPCDVTLSADAETTGAIGLGTAWQRLVLPYTSDGSVTLQMAIGLCSVVFDYAQDEAGGVTSPVATTGTSATRDVETATIPSTGATAAEGCLLLTVTPTWTGATPHLGGNRFATFGSANAAAGYSNANNDTWSAYGGPGSGPSGVAAGFTASVAATYLTTWTVAGNQLATHNVTTSTAGSATAYVGMSGFVSDTLDFGPGAGASPRPNAYLSDLVLGSTSEACQ